MTANRPPRTYGIHTERWGFQPTAWWQGGVPTWAWRCAPAGLVTRRQMRAQGLSPGKAEVIAQVVCRRGRKVAYLYDPAECRPKRVATPAQLAAATKATKARRWCPTGRHYADYCIPTSLGECIECHYRPAAAEPTEQNHQIEQEAAA